MIQFVVILFNKVHFTTYDKGVKGRAKLDISQLLHGATYDDLVVVAHPCQSKAGGARTIHCINGLVSFIYAFIMLGCK